MQKRHLSAFGFRICHWNPAPSVTSYGGRNKPPALPVNSLSAWFRSTGWRRQIWDNTKLLGGQ
jgi:hypothetical protein